MYRRRAAAPMRKRRAAAPGTRPGHRRAAATVAPSKTASARKERADEKRQSNAIGTAIGMAIGSYFGGPFGAGIGGTIGGGAQELVRKITGFGDYTVSRNSVLHPDETPMFRPETNGSIVISYREYIEDVITSATAGAFKRDDFEVNPGLGTTFPWLSTIAGQFEEYQPLGMVFAFKSNSGNALNSVNTALGSVVIASEYNPLNAPFPSKQAAEQSVFSSSCQPSADMLHPLECDPKQTRELFNVRGSSIPAGGDPRLYDLCRTSVITTGMQGTSVNIGELWVTYSIRFLKPKLGQTVALGDHFQLPPAAGDVTSAKPFGGAAVAPVVNFPPTSTSNLGVVLDQVNNQIVFPQGLSGNVSVYNEWFWDVAGSSTTSPTITPTGGIVPLNLLGGDSVNAPAYTAVDAPILAGSSYWTLDGSGGRLTYSAQVIPLQIVSGDIIISLLPEAMSN